MFIQLHFRFFTVLFLTLTVISCDNKHERANKYVGNAQAAYKKGDIESAKIEFNNALSAESDRIDALYGLAKILEKEQKWHQYHNFLKRIIELDPEHADALLRFSTLNLASGKIDIAIELADKTLELTPNNSKAWVLKASIQARLDDKKGAKLSLKNALAFDENNDEASLLFANIYMADAQYTKALEILDRGINRNSSNAYFYAIKIRALNELGKKKESIDTFKKLITLDQSNPAIYNVLAKQYIELGEIELARETLVQFAEKYPSQKSVFNLVSFYEKHNSTKETEAVIQDYRERFNHLFSLNFLLSDFFLKNNQLENAREVLESSIQQAPDIQNKLSAKNQLAVLELAEENWDSVESITKDILSQDPENFRAITLKARAYLKQEKTESAIRLLRSVLNNDSENAFILFLLAQAHQQQGIIELANDHFQKSVLLSNHHSEFSISYAQFLLKLNRLTQAEQVLEKTPLVAGDAGEVLELLAQIKLQQGKWNEAERIARQIEKIDDGQSRSAQIMGLVHSGKNNTQRSIEAFQTAYKESSKNFRPLLSLINSYLKADRISEAKQFLDRILKEDSDNLYALILQGRVYTFTKEIKKAESSLKDAVAHHPNRYQAHISLYDFYVLTGQTKQAEKTLENAIKLLPSNLSLTVKLASTREKLGNIAEAKSLYEQWLSHSPNTAIIKNNYASVLLQSTETKDLEKALELVSSLSNSQIPHFLDTSGWAHYKNGQIQTAVRQLEQAAKELKGVPEFDYHLGMAYIAQGSQIRGANILKTALERAKSEASWRKDAEAALEK